MRGLILAVQFLTRLPTPRLATFDPAWLTESARWFATGGLMGGVLLAAAAGAGALIDPWLAALAVVGVWTWVTGALHLDGLADLADGLGAAHRSPERFLAVLKDPHVGSFGGVALVMQLATKLGLVMLLVQTGTPWLAWLLLPAWARLGAVYWSGTMPQLAAGGQAERFGWCTHWPSFWLSFAALAAASAWFAPALLVAPLLWLAWRRTLMARLGGVTGDCLGAGIELSESGLLLALLLVAKWLPDLV